jgi:hypothetical protein
MAVGFPVKDDYATGDVLTAANMNDFAGTLNTVEAPLGNAAGKNKIINGDFSINQRAFTSTTTNAVYTFDRWLLILTNGGGTVTCTAQTFTPGSAPVSGYESTNFARIVTAGQTTADSRAAYEHRIEDVRSFAGQTITVSFYAKSGSGTPNINAQTTQVFGPGGSSDVATVVTKKTISTSWDRYSFTLNVPSISGKTIGTSSYLRIRIWVSAGADNASVSDTLGIQNNTFDIWGVQAEAGSIATPFQTATGTIQGELAACQRYFWRNNATALNPYGVFGTAIGATSTEAYGYLMPSVPMRTINSITTSNICLIDGPGALIAVTLVLQSNYTSQNLIGIYATAASGITANRPYHLQANNNVNAFVAVDGEL